MEPVHGPTEGMLLQLAANGLAVGSTYALIGLGFGLIYQTARFFHFAHGAVFTWGAYFTYLFTVTAGLPIALGAVLSVAVTAALGALTDLVVYRPLRARHATALVLLITSLGLFVFLQNGVSILFGDDTKTLGRGPADWALEMFGARITGAQLLIISTSAVLFVVITLALKRTRIGLAIRAVANDPELAQVSGLEVERIVPVVFAVGSGLAAVAAILIALDVDMTPAMGQNALLMGVVAVVVGGVGSVPGAALGGLVTGLAQQFGVWRINSQWQDAIAFAILLTFLLFRPSGFFGWPVRKVEV